MAREICGSKNIRFVSGGKYVCPGLWLFALVV
jgi:hypothetical protein